MGNVGDIERITQNRVVKLFKEKLHKKGGHPILPLSRKSR